MEISQKGIDLIKKFEGCRLTAYKCPAGVWTIGYGHTGSIAGPNVKITQETANCLLAQDLTVHSNNVSKLVTVPVTQNQFDALVSFEFNVGFNALKTSTLLRLLNQKKYNEAAGQFDRWIYANKKILQGLVNRRREEKALFLKTD